MSQLIIFSIHTSQFKKLKRLANKNKTTKSAIFRRMLYDFNPGKIIAIREKKEKSIGFGVQLTDDEIKKIDSFCYNRSLAARKIIEQYET